MSNREVTLIVPSKLELMLGISQIHVATPEEKRIRRNALRRERDQVMRDMGLVKVRGNLGGTYWE